MTDRRRALIPLYDDTAAIACTITDAEIPDRIAIIERMRAAVIDLERTDHGFILHFQPDGDDPDDLRADIDRFMVDEQRCCEFWGFALDTTGGLRLRWDGPPAARDLIDSLADYFAGRTDFTDLRGLL